MENILKLFVKKLLSGIVSYLLLDKNKCHYQDSLEKFIEDLRVEWDIIPGKCTGLVQLVNVGIEKLFKHQRVVSKHGYK